MVSVISFEQLKDGVEQHLKSTAPRKLIEVCGLVDDPDFPRKGKQLQSWTELKLKK